MKMLIEKLIKWAFGNRIKIFKAQYYHTDRMTQLGYGLPETKEQIKKRLLNDLIYELADKEIIKFSKRRDVNSQTDIFEIKIICVD
jgi:transcription initiation factor IIE alpha subunit